MSAFEGKADVDQSPTSRLLLTQNALVANSPRTCAEAAIRSKLGTLSSLRDRDVATV
jgi:hypothetical protein